MKIKRSHVIVTGLVLLGVTFLMIGIRYVSEPTRFFAHSLRNWQEADSVAGYPIATAYDEKGAPVEFRTAEFEPNLSTLTAMERYLVPTAQGFHRPKGAQAAATGLVIYTGDPEGYPGQAVLLAHRLPDRSLVQTFYAGLSEVEVSVGDTVARGATLGTGGHLLEIREGSGIDLHQEKIAGFLLNSQESPSAPNRLVIDDFLAEHPLPHSGPDPLGIMQAERDHEIRAGLGIAIE